MSTALDFDTMVDLPAAPRSAGHFAALKILAVKI